MYCTEQRLREDERGGRGGGGEVAGGGGWVCLDGLTPTTQKDWEAEICCFHQPFPPYKPAPTLLVTGLSGKSEVPKSVITNM